MSTDVENEIQGQLVLSKIKKQDALLKIIEGKVFSKLDIFNYLLAMAILFYVIDKDSDVFLIVMPILLLMGAAMRHIGSRIKALADLVKLNEIPNKAIKQDK